MGSTIRARVRGGVLEPLEPLELEEGKEVTLTIAPVLAKPHTDWLSRTEGGWVGLVDGEKLKKDICESRSSGMRPES